MPAASPTNIRTAAQLIGQGLDPAVSTHGRLIRMASALNACRAFVSDLQHPGDREAAALLREIDRALDVRP